MGKNQRKHKEQQQHKTQQIQQVEDCPICKGAGCHYCWYTGKIKIVTDYQQEPARMRGQSR